MTSQLNAAIMKLKRRAERQATQDLVKTFVSAGSVYDRISTEDHQIIYGRRGTGKTHLLTYLSEQQRERGDYTVMVDLRTVGSNGGLYNDATIPLAERGTRLLCDVLAHLYNSLSDAVLAASYEDGGSFGSAMTALDQFADAITDVRIDGTVSRQEEAADATRDASGLSVNVTTSHVGISAETSSGHDATTRTVLRREGAEVHHLHFGAVTQSIASVVEALPGRVWLLLDEWSDVPLDLQPFLADLLRRSLMTANGVTVKICAIEQRTSFAVSSGAGSRIGFELGADIAADIELDDYMVFGNNQEVSAVFFGDLLYRHIANEAGDRLSEDIRDATDLVRHAFTQVTAFNELVRAAEGVPRDLINVAILAAQAAGDSQISVPNVRSAARSWYLRDKEKAVQSNESATLLLHWIIDEVIGTRKARAFLLEQGSPAREDVVLYLYDARVLHVIKRGVSSHDARGRRFDVYTLDYGCYVHLANTAAEPEGLFTIEDAGGTEHIVAVPEDDYRSIRRAVLDIEQFQSQ